MPQPYKPSAPYIVQFPLRGEWMATYTPAARVPSHGLDIFGETYAYDFVRGDWDKKGYPFYRGNLWRYLTRGVQLRDCPGWGQGVYAPFAGRVVAVHDGMAERMHLHWYADLRRAARLAAVARTNQNSWDELAGNYVVVENGQGVYAALCHLQNQSVAVAVGQQVVQGDFLGRLGHSGNSMAPHLHFQLMDHADPNKARGLPCAFAAYEVWQPGAWQPVYDGMPALRQRIRFLPQPHFGPAQD